MANQLKKRWQLCAPNGWAEFLSQELKVSPLTAQILANRGIKEIDQARKFLFPSLSDLPDPFLMRDMEKISARIWQALSRKEKITIFGDYDVDGATATALLFLFLKKAGAQVDFYLPNRLQEGYGLNIAALKKIRSEKTDLIITVDCGINDKEEISWARENGLEVIITDHHEIPENLPPALAILNPKQKNCAYPFKELAGVGVAFNLVIALRTILRQKGFWPSDSIPNLKEFLDLVALGTVADVVPLVSVNRLLVKFGLSQLNQSQRPGIRALKEVVGVDVPFLDTNAILFRCGPRLNAVGRLGAAQEAVHLLITNGEKEAQQIASRLNQTNSLRQRIEEKIYASAKEMIVTGNMWPAQKSLVLAAPDWHPGVIGIVASRLAEEFCRPTILIACQEKLAKGSGRSIPSFSLFQGLKRCQQWMEDFGGHEQAAGLLIRPELIPHFSRAFEEVVRSFCREEDFLPILAIDALIHLQQIDETFLRELELLAPFGPGNPEPILAGEDLEVLESRLVAKNHLRLRLKEGKIIREAIGFNMASFHPLSGQRVRLAFSPSWGLYQGRKIFDLKIVDLQLKNEAER